MKAKDPKEISRMFIWFAVIATVVCLSIMAAAIKRDHMFFTQNQRANVTRELNLIARTLDEKLFSIELVSHRIAATASAEPDETSRRAVDQIASRLRQQYPDIISIAIAPDLKVNHVHPLKGNEAVLGIEYWNLPDQFVGIARAYRERSPVFLGPINLVQGGRGFIVRYPVFVPNGAGKTGDRFWGVISVVIEETGLFSGADPQAAPLTIGLREMDGRGGERGYLAGNAALFNADPVVLPLSAVGDNWQIGALPSGGWRAQSPNLIILLTGGLFVTGLLLTALMLIRRSTMQQAASHNILMHAIDALDEGFILYDSNDRVVMYNEKFLTYWNRSEDEIRVGTKFETLLRLGVRDGEFEDAIGREEEWIAERLAARDAGQTTLQRMSDGRWLKSSDARTPDGYSVGIRSDVTHQKNAQLAAEKANQTKSEFLSNVTHDLRTPLTVIMGYAAFLSNESEQAPLQKLASILKNDEVDLTKARSLAQMAAQHVVKLGNKIDNSASHMLAMVNDLLDLTRIESGNLTLNIESHPARDIARETVDELRPLARKKGLDLVCHGNAGHVLADQSRIKQVLYNLVGNAVKFTDTGGVLVKVEDRDGFTVFTVEDTGCGIPPEQVDRVFERFEQVQGPQGRAHKGFGLGLSIARKIVNLHGGTIHATSELGKGSQFIFTLPHAEAPKVTKPAPVQQSLAA